MFRKLTPYLPKIRMQVFKFRFASVGRRAGLGRNVRILGNARIELGDRSTIRDDVQIAGNGELIIGARTVINEECILTAMERIVIGDDVMLAPRVYILDVDHKFERREIPISQQGYTIAPVTIGDGVWIGTGAVITKGVTIGDGAIIGANSVVVSDIPAFTIAGGVPARVIKKRPE